MRKSMYQLRLLVNLIIIVIGVILFCLGLFLINTKPLTRPISIYGSS
jgi:hypothetical protein